VRGNGEWALLDGSGSARQMTDGGQNVTSASVLTAYGQTVGVSGSTSCGYTFQGSAGYRTDSGDGPAGGSSYTKVGARYYDAEWGRFITRDTDLSQSPYAYCDGDPVNCTDPSGHLSAVNIASGGIAIAGEIDGAASAPVDTSGDNTSSSTGYPAVGGSSSGSGTGDVAVSVTQSGLSSTATVTSASDHESISVTANNGNPISATVGGNIPLGGILSGLSFTFSDLDKFGGVNQQSAGLGYQSGIFKVGISGNSAGGWVATAGISTH